MISKVRKIGPKGFFLLALLIFAQFSSGCLLSKKSGDSPIQDPGKKNQDPSGYIRGILPNVLDYRALAPLQEKGSVTKFGPEKSSDFDMASKLQEKGSGPAFALENPYDWNISVPILDRSTAPDEEGIYAVPFYPDDKQAISAGSTVKILVSYRGKTLSGHSSLEKAKAYEVDATPDLTIPSIQVGVFSNGDYVILSKKEDAQQLFVGWNHFILEEYDKAMTLFDKIIDKSAASSQDKANAHAGKGWCLARMDGIDDSQAEKSFEKGKDDNLGKLGLACYYMAKGEKISTAITHLSDIGLSGASYNFSAGSLVGITNTHAHGLLALCYAYIGRNELAEIQGSQLNSEDGYFENQVIEMFQSFGILEN